MTEPIREASIDLETFSSVDLQKCGVYRYAESPDFEILLFGYSINGGDVHVVDVASGEKIPEEILAALSDNRVTKWAYNASFERVCLSEWLRRNYPEYFKSYGDPDDTVGHYLDPAGWKCSRIWGAYMGLPLSLAAIGRVLNLSDQKMSEGKDLIRYFCVPCKPTKANGGRTRNLPADDPEKWSVFKSYNKRDVEVELAIKKRLSNYPVPDFIWDQYHIDQMINDRGIGVDMQLVNNALAIDAKTKDALMKRMQDLTGLENPNSVSQMKSWLSGQGIKTESLDKKAVRALLADADDTVTEVLTCRQQLAKSSVSKYKAMENMACSDSRARGCFMFYGANRTGRWCLTGDHEVLTPEGWQRLDEWNGGHIACWNASTEAVSFQPAKALRFSYEGPMYTYRDARIDQCSTPDHKMRVRRKPGDPWTDMTVQEMSSCRPSIPPSIPITGYRYHRGCCNPAWLRVLIMTQADGHYAADGAVRFHFKKLRKIERCKHLLRKAEITFVEHIWDNTATITIPARAVPLWLREFRTKTFGFWLFDENPDIFFDELPNWDGYYPAPNSIQYSTCNKQNADIVQALAHMSGRTAVMRVKKHHDINKKWKDAYVLDIWLTPGNAHEIKAKPSITDFNGTVYCAETRTGYFIVRRNGKVWVTGNSGRGIQLQNLPQNHMGDLAEARSLVRDGNFEALSLLYDNVPDVLSQLIRTAFIPKPGMKYIVSDFSSIEARVLAHLAGEKWKSDAFAEGQDIYCSTASKMFGVPVVKHGVNGELRQKGKISELACIARDELVLTDHGLKPIQNVLLSDRVWDGESWVTHDGVIYMGEREVITYEGLTATPDHLVFIEGQDAPVRFSDAAGSGSHLVRTGDGRREVRLGKNHLTGKTVDKTRALSNGTNDLYELREPGMDQFIQPKAWLFKSLSALFKVKTYSKMARPEAHSRQAALRESLRSGMEKLRRAWHPVLLPVGDRGGIVPDRNLWPSGQVDGNRPDRHERQLRARKYPVCDASGEPAEQAQHRPFPLRAALLALFPFRRPEKTLAGRDAGRDHPGRGDSGLRAPKELAHHQRTARLYDIRNAGRHHRFTVSGKLVHNCGYGGSVGALKAMGALEMGLAEEELQPIVDAWRAANPHIVRLWWDIDRAVKEAVIHKASRESHGFRIYYQSGMLFIDLPSGRRLCYVKPKIGMNRFGSDCVTYEGTGTGKWVRLESYGPKFVENIVQAVSRDILAYAMQNLVHCQIVGHVHDELIIECPRDTQLNTICDKMGETPPWIPGLLLRADGYECDFYMKS